MLYLVNHFLWCTIVADSRNGGYATDPTYIKKITDIVKSNNLIAYDKVVIGEVVAAKIKQEEKITKDNKSIRIHKVVAGDTLSEIAKRYKTTVTKILTANKATNPKITANHIVVGRTLKV